MLFLACSASALVGHGDNARVLQGVTKANCPSPSIWIVRFPSNRFALFFQFIMNLLLGRAVKAPLILPHTPCSFVPLIPHRPVIFGHDDATAHGGSHDDNFEGGFQPRPDHHPSSVEGHTGRVSVSVASEGYGEIAARSRLHDKSPPTAPSNPYC